MTDRTKIKLDDYGQNLLDLRAKTGERCIYEAGGWTADGRRIEGEDRETAASDAISDILTALFGPAGTYSNPEHGIGKLNPNEFALNEARRLVEHAFRSWEGDAEDYTEVPEVSLAFEIADAIVNQGGYADDPEESDLRADERDRLIPIIEATLSEELGGKL